MTVMEKIEAVVKQGHRVASGTSASDPRFNEDGGTIRLQIPEFKKHGLDLDVYFGGRVDEAYVCGTLGLDMAPQHLLLVNPEYYFTDVRWTDKFDQRGAPFVENFYLSPARVTFNGVAYKALLYIPDPKTKPGHYHPPSTVEVIAQKIPGIAYGDKVILEYNPDAIRLVNSGPLSKIRGREDEVV